MKNKKLLSAILLAIILIAGAIFAGLFDEYYNACRLLISQRYEA